MSDPTERSAGGSRMVPDEYGEDGLSPRDRRIKQLNHEGYSIGQISKILKSDPEDWGLSASSVCEHLKEMRLDSGNQIRANFQKFGGKPKEEQKWSTVMLILRKDTESYTRLMGFKPMIRTMFYQHVDEGHVKPDEYNAFVKAATDARIGYVGQDGELLLPRLPIDCFDDDSQVAEDYEDYEPEEMLEPLDIPDEDEYIDEIVKKTKQAPAMYEGVGEAGFDGKVGGYWFGQPEYVEVWIEKNGLMKGFQKILKRRTRYNQGK